MIVIRRVLILLVIASWALGCGSGSVNGEDGGCDDGCPVDGGLPDLVVSAIVLDPADPVAGQVVTFSASILNQGSVATPDGVILGVAFSIDGVVVAWSDTHNAFLRPGDSVMLAANGGPAGTAAWAAMKGSHTVSAWANDVGRFAESDVTNNRLSWSFTVSNGTKKPAIGNSLITYDGFGASTMKNLQNDPRITWDFIGHSSAWAYWGAAEKPRPNTTIVYQMFTDYTNHTLTDFDWVRSRFDKATAESQSAKKWEYGAYMMTEEIFHPALRASWSRKALGLSTWKIDGKATFSGVEVKLLKTWCAEEKGVSWSSPGVAPCTAGWWSAVSDPAQNGGAGKFDDATVWEWSGYFNNGLMKAWNNHLHALGKRSAMWGFVNIIWDGDRYDSMAKILPYFFPGESLNTLMQFDLLVTYKYPTTSALTAASEEDVKTLRQKFGYTGQLVHHLTSCWSDGAGCPFSEAVAQEEFNRVAPYVDVIVASPYADGVFWSPGPLSVPYPPLLMKFFDMYNPP